MIRSLGIIPSKIVASVLFQVSLVIFKNESWSNIWEFAESYSWRHASKPDKKRALFANRWVCARWNWGIWKSCLLCVLYLYSWILLRTRGFMFRATFNFLPRPTF